MVTDHHDMIEKKTVESEIKSKHNKTTATTTGILIVRLTMGYFVMTVRIILVWCNRKVNRTIVFLILL